MSFSVVIPARFASTRLPGKPLLDIGGKSMIQRVYENASSSSASEVIVATDDQRIADVVDQFGGQVIMTSAAHQSGTDRIQEVAQLKGYSDEHIIVNVQGDEPLLDIAVIEQVATNLKGNRSAGIATLCEKIESNDVLNNPNAVKVVKDKSNLALYFSRLPIPHYRDRNVAAESGNENSSPKLETDVNSIPVAWFRHIGIYGYRVNVLNDFVTWPQSMLETLESLEQLRALENGVRIHCQEACVPVPAGVDTQDDLEQVREYLASRDN